MLKKLIKILFAKKDYLPPRKNNVLVIDDNFRFILDKEIKKPKLEYLDVRLNRINIFVILKLFFSNKKKNFFNYAVEYIKLTEPKTIITFNDNLIWFYKIKIVLPKINVVSFQNGFRNKFFFENLKKYEPLCSDIIFVFNDKIGSQFKKYIKTKTVTLGSVKNNFKKKNTYKKKRKSILLVSGGHPEGRKYFASNEKNGFKFKSSEFYGPDAELFKNLLTYCKINKFELEVASKNALDKNEFKFFKNLAKKNNFIYHKNTYKNMITYDISNQVLATVSSHSTFGPENLARGNRTAIFNNKKKPTNGIFDVFWFLNVKKKGSFWSDDVSLIEIKRVLGFVLNSNDLIWRKKTSNIIKNLMKYDSKNERLFKTFKNL